MKMIWPFSVVLMPRMLMRRLWFVRDDGDLLAEERVEKG
jgi:hypothetical protein